MGKASLVLILSMLAVAAKADFATDSATLSRILTDSNVQAFMQNKGGLSAVQKASNGVNAGYILTTSTCSLGVIIEESDKINPVHLYPQDCN